MSARFVFLTHDLAQRDARLHHAWITWLHRHGIGWTDHLDSLLECDDDTRTIHVERAPIGDNGKPIWQPEPIEDFIIQLESPALPFPK